VKIEHIAIWTENLERSRSFYVDFFGAISNQKYENTKKDFTSYFLSFDTGCRLEIMNITGKSKCKDSSKETFFGISHFAISVGSKLKVDELTLSLSKKGFTIVSEPRVTGDGYYESIVLDPDGNRIEITE
jgi:lactoylglutathione lyase